MAGLKSLGKTSIYQVMKSMLLALMTVMILANMANAKAVDEWTFFSGAHLGMTIEEAAAFYRPGTPGTIATGGSTSWGGAPSGQHYVDFRNYDSHDWRVLVCYRESDGKIVLVDYWKIGEKFSKEQTNYLTDLNRPYGPLVSRLDDDSKEFVITTPEQDKLEQEAIRPL
jgi:hypothetical protein